MYLSIILNNEASTFLFYIEIGIDFNFTRISTNSVKYTFQFNRDEVEDLQSRRIKELIKKTIKLVRKFGGEKYVKHQNDELADAVKVS